VQTASPLQEFGPMVAMDPQQAESPLMSTQESTPKVGRQGQESSLGSLHSPDDIGPNLQELQIFLELQALSGIATFEAEHAKLAVQELLPIEAVAERHAWNP
jgi:hypothetical protein